MSGTVQMYRLRVARGNSSGGSGDWSYFESWQRFNEAVLLALIEVAGNTNNRDWSRAARAWLVSVERGGDDVKTGEWLTTRLVAAEQLVDGDWFDLRPSLNEPRVEWGAEPVAGQEAGT